MSLNAVPLRNTAMADDDDPSPLLSPHGETNDLGLHSNVVDELEKELGLNNPGGAATAQVELNNGGSSGIPTYLPPSRGSNCQSVEPPSQETPTYSRAGGNLLPHGSLPPVTQLASTFTAMYNIRGSASANDLTETAEAQLHEARSRLMAFDKANLDLMEVSQISSQRCKTRAGHENQEWEKDNYAQAEDAKVKATLSNEPSSSNEKAMSPSNEVATKSKEKGNENDKTDNESQPTESPLNQ